MKVVSTLILAVLVFLAVSSGITKVMLVQRDVEFFGAFGFTNPILIAYGIAQIVGGVLMVLKRTRSAGAAIVAITFLVSLYVLMMDGNVLFSIMTIVSTALLLLVIRQNWPRKSQHGQ